jgi:GNAT superfamily N-acetyltransferase
MLNPLFNKIDIRTWEDSDFENAVILNREAEEHIGMKSENGDWVKDMEGVSDVFLKGGGDFLVGFLDKKLIVMGGYKRLAKKQIEIKRMRVSPDLQGKGIGRWFLELLEKKAKESGITYSVVSTTSKQTGALRLYSGSGYKEVGRRIEDRGHDKGLTIVSFTKKLA